MSPATERPPLVAEAARGHLPSWARVRPKREAHLERVRLLLTHWAGVLGLDPEEGARWAALGTLHDALRDAPASSLRDLLQGSTASGPPPGGDGEGEDAAEGAAGGFPFLPATPWDLPAPLLHGPAAARRLAGEGLEDVAFLRAVAFHTLGHPALDAAGRALYCADALEPGRPDPDGWRARLREAFPGDPAGVLAQVLGRRMMWQVEGRHHLHPDTVAFWNAAAARAPEAPGEGARP
jgi:HD superfamily phosphohydrolase YqeK